MLIIRSSHSTHTQKNYFSRYKNGSRGIKIYKSISKERLLRALSELVGSKNSFDDDRLKKIRKDFHELRDRFSKPQIKEVKKNLYDIKNQKIFQQKQ